MDEEELTTLVGPHSTTTAFNSQTLTLENLKKAADYIQAFKSKPLPKGMSWFTRLMAKFGWHRQYEIMFFDKSKFDFWKFKDF